jgi:pimeloyl-ACP methyl ester carboxylesterase
MSANRSTPTVSGTTCVAALLLAAVFAEGQVPAQAQKSEHDKMTMQRVTSRDGTRIAYEKSGNGPAVILVTGALATRASTSELAQLLSTNFTVYRYDRRGRGDSADTKPYAVRREVEDIAALIDAAGGSAYVYGKSSGASLALEAASSLGDRITRLAIYEAPYSEAAGAANEWRAFTSRLDSVLAANRRAEAVTFFLKFVGVPDEAIAGMKASAAWPEMEAMAPTLAYDNAVVGEDRSVPTERAAKLKAATLVMDGGASAGPMPFMRATADKLANVIPGAQRRTVEGQAHDVSSRVLAPILMKFFN